VSTFGDGSFVVLLSTIVSMAFAMEKNQRKNIFLVNETSRKLLGVV